MEKQGVFSFRGKARDVQQMAYYFMVVDSKMERTLWEYDDIRGIWRRATRRGGR